MRRYCAVAAACVLVIAGCRKPQEKKAAAVPTVVHTAAKAEHPYYYGLIEEYRNILSQDPNNLAALIALGNAYSESGAWREAIEQYQHALRIEPQSADVRTDLGTAFRNIGLPSQALAEYRLALGHEPGHLNARYQMGVLYAFDFRDYKVAMHVWEELLRLAPNHPNADFMRAKIAMYKKAQKEHP